MRLRIDVDKSNRVTVEIYVPSCIVIAILHYPVWESLNSLASHFMA